MKNKKFTLLLGSIIAVSAPIMTVVSCGNGATQYKIGYNVGGENAGLPKGTKWSDFVVTDGNRTYFKASSVKTWGDFGPGLTPPSTMTFDRSSFTGITLSPNFVVPKKETLPKNFQNAIIYALARSMRPANLTGDKTIPMIWTDYEMDEYWGMVPKEGSKLKTATWADYVKNKKLLSSSFSYFTKFPEGFNVPKDITEVGDRAFSWTNLPDSFQLPDSVSKIGLEVFRSAKVASNFKLPAKLKDYSSDSFDGLVTPISTNGTKLPMTFDKYDPTENEKPLPGAKLIQGAWTMFVKNGETVRGLGEIKLQSGFQLDPSIHKLANHFFVNVTLNDDFVLPDNLTLTNMSFREATLNAGFTIPANTKLEGTPFYQVNLPEGYKWSKLNGEDPIVGSTVVKK